MDKRDKGTFVTGGMLFFLALVLQLCARRADGFATWYAHHIYPVEVGNIGRFFGIFPFSVVEILLYALIVGVLLYFARNIRHPFKIVSRTVLLTGILLFLYTVNCGINYYAAAFSDYAGIRAGTYTKEELKDLCTFLVENVNATVTEAHYKENRSEWKQAGVAAMAQASKEFPCLAGFYPQPKEVTCSAILSVQQLCGIYSPFTMEANFNGDMPDYNIPHTICHELSHLKGFMREDEANFIGYLACISSDSMAYRYSGYLTGWVYAGNALAEVDPEAYLELRGKLDARAETDLQANNVFWNRYDGRVAEAANQLNDTYLKMNDQNEGVQSYGRMVDLMLAYRKNR